MSIYEQLNPEQQEAVYQTEGPLLILAGAGSGKTRTLTHRIAYLIEEKDVNPWNILAITFTNKAAGEMRERVDAMVDFGAEAIWVSTFHSCCVRILRRHIEAIGYENGFSIYDTDDQKTLLHQVMKKLDVDQKQYKDRAVMKYISSAKDELITPEQFCKKAVGDYRKMRIGEIYTEYQAALKKNNALDFDDIINKTVELFTKNPQILEMYQDRFRYIMVDEYQDTNTAQFELVRLLASKYRNLCVVGDDDQSIYKFRGANIRNILNFEQHFPGARIIRLEQNYRSTQNILDAANEVIRNNRGRRDKRLWTENEEGKRVKLKQFENASLEAEEIAQELLNVADQGYTYKDCAVLYRTNAQSRLIEERLVNKGIPYQLVGGVNFYQRKEIKDVLAYLKTIDNGADDVAVARIINVPKRGIGGTTIGRVQEFADMQGMSFYEALKNIEYISSIKKGKATVQIKSFVDMIEEIRTMGKNGCALEELLEAVLEKTGYKEELTLEDTIESRTRLENIEELVTKAVDFENHQAEQVTLSQFLEEVALVADIDRMDDVEDKVLLMTLHSAKGLEFNKVFLCGMEDGLFPSMMSINSGDPDDMEEERRLAYVGITRAKKDLTLTAARQRMVNGETRYSRLSRFCMEIPPHLLDSNMSQNAVKVEAASIGRKFGLDGDNDKWGSHKKTADADKWGYSKKQSPLAGVSGAYGGRVRKAGEPVYGGSQEYQPSSFEKRNAGGSGFGKSFEVEKSGGGLGYEVGDWVKHMKFGEGKVLAITEGKRDYEVTVDFDNVGMKRMFASFAKLKKVEE